MKTYLDRASNLKSLVPIVISILFFPPLVVSLQDLYGCILAIAPQVYGDYDETIYFLRGRGLLANARTCSK